MIKIEITRITTETYTETVNFITKKTATDKFKPKDYGCGTEPVFNEEYEAQDVDKERKRTIQLLTQEIDDESKFNLSAVIVAINGL